MATAKKLSDLTNLTDIDESDLLLAVDISDKTSAPTGTTKKVLFSEIKNDVKADLNIANWNAAYSWGDHASAGYLTSASITETDPVFTASAAYNITSTKTQQWDAAYSWGNHAVQGYLQSIAALSINALNDVEIDSGTLTTDQVLRWNGTSWVNGTGAGGTTINGINDIGDVNITSVADSEFLKYDSSTSKWINSPIPEINAINDIGDVNIGGNLANDHILRYNSTSGNWENVAPQEFVESDTLQSVTSRGASSNVALTLSSPLTVEEDVISEGFKFSVNNTTISGTTGTQGEIRQIGGAPFFYDGTNWREFYLIGGTTVTQDADTDWDSVIIRSTFDDDFNDVKYNAVGTSNYGLASIVGSPTRVGTGSLKLPGDWVEYPYRSEYDFDGAWTIEAWIYVDSLPVQSTYMGDSYILFGNNSSTTASKRWHLGLSRSSSQSQVEFYWYNNNNPNYSGTYSPGMGATITTDTASVYNQTWFHVALTHRALDGTLRLYLDGSPVGSVLTENDILNGGNFVLGGGNAANELDGFIDDLRVSTFERYTSSFTPQTTPLPITGSSTEFLLPPTNKRGEITLGVAPTWTGTSGVTVTQESSGNYRLTFTTSYTNANDYFVTVQPMDQGSASYVSVVRSTTHVDFAINAQSNDAAVDTGSLAVEITNHV